MSFKFIMVNYSRNFSVTLRLLPFTERLFSRRHFVSLFRSLPEKNTYNNVTNCLKSIYRKKLLPLEEEYLFHDFHSPKLTDQDFDAKPMIMLMGQYSTGKTSLIRYLVEQDYPGIRIGPEPTTDKFIVIMGGEKENFIPGNALVSDPNKPFAPLSQFGNTFLSRFQCSMVPSPVLDGITFLDTPGILSGEKQRVDRGYDFTGVLQWFAERSDRIILLFDANKLDISDEFRRSIEVIRAYDEKIRIILNKADSVGHQELLRVYGALMWSLGKVLNTPEVAKIYVGSFWSEPLRYDMNRRLFEDEEKDLFKDIQSLPRNSALRKVNDLSKRARIAKVHAYLIAELKSKTPTFFGQGSAKRRLIDDLPSIFEDLRIKYKISPGDFPEVEQIKGILEKHNFEDFNHLNPAILDLVDDMMVNDIPQIMNMIPLEKQPSAVSGGLFDDVQLRGNPFAESSNKLKEGSQDPDWIVTRYRTKYDEIFSSLDKIDSKAVPEAAKSDLMKSKLPNSVLARVWFLADVDKDGLLDVDEFALAKYLIDLKLDGNELPSQLPKHLIPPSKRSASKQF